MMPLTLSIDDAVAKRRDENEGPRECGEQVECETREVVSPFVTASDDGEPGEVAQAYEPQEQCVSRDELSMGGHAGAIDETQGSEN